MIFSGRFCNPVRWAQRCGWVLATIGLVFPGISLAQPQAVLPPVAPQSVWPDGIYLFGQSAEREQIGLTYVILSVLDSQVVGAFYQPRSSFDCFYGQLSPERLWVNVVDSYEQAVYPYDLALTLETAEVAGEGVGRYTLTGYQRLDNPSENERYLLSVCQSSASPLINLSQ